MSAPVMFLRTSNGRGNASHTPNGPQFAWVLVAVVAAVLLTFTAIKLFG